MKMKKLTIGLIGIMLFLFSESYGQNEMSIEKETEQEMNLEKQRSFKSEEIKTLAGKNVHSGGFGALSFRSSEFRDKALVLTGLRGGWIINRTLAIGLEAHGIVPTAKFDGLTPNGKAVLLGGYGGMFLEPILFSNKVIHITFPVSGGAGWLGYHEDWEENNNADVRDDLIDDDVFWYIEPGVGLEVNVSRHFRINTGVTRRFTQDLELQQTQKDSFDKMSYFLTLKIGSF